LRAGGAHGLAATRGAGRGRSRQFDRAGPEGPVEDTNAQAQIDYFARNARDFGFEMFDVFHALQGIEHVVLPDLGWVLPGMVFCSGRQPRDDLRRVRVGRLRYRHLGYRASLGANAAPARYPAQDDARDCEWALPLGTTAKDMVMAVIRQIGAAARMAMRWNLPGRRCALGIEGRMTLCNMAVECGARVALIAPDAVVLAAIAGGPRAPGRRCWRGAGRRRANSPAIPRRGSTAKSCWMPPRLRRW